MAVRAYRPTAATAAAAAEAWPTIFFFMGGAYKECKLDDRDFFCGNLARCALGQG